MNRYLKHGWINLAFLSALLLWGLPVQAEDKYSREDLQALVEQQEWLEILEHGKDISPRERDDEWKAWIEAAAIGMLAESNSESSQDSYQTMQQIDDRYRHLSQSDDYMSVRAEVGIAALQDCLQNSYYANECNDALTTFVAGDETNVSLNLSAAKLTRQHLNASLALPYFVTALEASSDEEIQSICADPDLELSVERALSQSNEDTAAPAVKLLDTVCHAELKTTLFDSFISGDHYIAVHTCSVWKGKGMLSDFQAAHCADVGAK